MGQDIDIVGQREILALLGIGLAVGALSAGLIAGGVLPVRSGVAGSLLLFLVVFLLHLWWRYGPLKAAVSQIGDEEFERPRAALDRYLASSFDRGGRPRTLAKVLKASCLFYQEQYEEALALAGEALKETDCEQIRFLAQNNIASCYICQHKPVKANAERAKVLTFGVTNDAKREALVNLGLCYMNCEFFREAVETWDEALKLFPDAEQRSYVLGFQAACYNRIRSYDNALEKVREAREGQPRAPLTRAILCDNEAFALANKKERLQEAYDLCQEGFRLKVPAAEPHLHMALGEVHYARGEFDEALEELKHAVDRVAKRDKVSRQKAYLTLGKIFQAKGMAKEAFEALNQAISIDPTRTLAVQAQQILQDPAAHNTAIQRAGEGLKQG